MARVHESDWRRSSDYGTMASIAYSDSRRSRTGCSHPTQRVVQKRKDDVLEVSFRVGSSRVRAEVDKHELQSRSLRRIVLGPLYSPVPFSDIILADILTSSAKVLGDLWVSGCVLFTATKTFGVGSTDDLDEACARVWMVPVMTR